MLKFCFSERWNDHEGYPRSLQLRPPKNWSYVGVQIEFDASRGRPWANFMVRPGHYIHASSLIPSNAVPWVFDTDHVEYLFQQMTEPCFDKEKQDWRSEMERYIALSFTTPYCIGIVAMSSSAASSLKELFSRCRVEEQDICIAHPGVVPPAGIPTAQEQEFLSKLRRVIRPRSIRLLCIDCMPGVCEVGDRKNLSDALLIFQAIRSKGVDVELIRIDRTMDSSHSSEGVHSLPRLSRSALWEVYSLYHILLFLTRADSLGLVLTEAMSLGLACVAAAGPSSPAVEEVIEHGQNGFLIRFGSPATYPRPSEALDIKSAIHFVEELAINHELRTKIGRNAKRAFEKEGCLSIETRNTRLINHVERKIELAAATGQPWAIEAANRA